MRIINDQKIYRVIDANFNRAKEGLRVEEDICRFYLDQKILSRHFKNIRHRLTDIIIALRLPRLIQARDIQKDVGKASTASEIKRAQVGDIFLANSQRVKESIRVLEEFTKLLNKNLATDLKKIRYQCYALEKKVAAKL